MNETTVDQLTEDYDRECAYSTFKGFFCQLNEQMKEGRNETEIE